MSSWFDAQTIAERLAALRTNPKALEHFDETTARSRLLAWKSLPAFRSDEDEARFRERLALDGTTEEEFLHVLGIAAEKLFADLPPPRWLRAVFESEETASLPLASVALDEAATRGMIHAYFPLIRLYARRLTEFLEQRPEVLAATGQTASRAVDLFLAPLMRRIEYNSRRAVALEINVQRMLGKLDGETPEARFASFNRKMADPAARLAFLGKYPVLTRSLQRDLEFWLEANVEFLERLAPDLAKIRDAFAIAPDDGIAEFQAGAGDIHCRGRSVAIVRFKSGKKILYKPRNLDVDVSFQELLRWCNARGLDPALRTFGVISGKDSGWVEFVENKPCESDAEIETFYRKLGTTLALLYWLATVDMHHENIVAAGTDPVIIDLETVFHSETQSSSVANATDAASRLVRESVMSVGLLPTPVVTPEGRTFDISGIGASAGQQAPYKVTFLQNVGKDDVHIAHVPGWIPSVHNRPTASTEKAIPAHALLAGFESGAGFILKHKAELLAQDGPLARFAENSGRLVVRATRYYGGLAIDAGHPDLLRDDLDRARHWDNAWNSVKGRTVLEKFIASEMRQIGAGDIPFFSLRIGGTEAIGADGTRIDDALVESGLEKARKRIGSISEAEIARQSWFLRGSLGHVAGLSRKPAIRASTNADPFLDAAREAGDEVLRNLIRFEDMACALHVSSITGENDLDKKAAYSIAAPGYGLYEGLSGIALFLAYLGRDAKDARYTEGAAALTRNIQAVIEQRRHKPRGISAFTGGPSLIYLYSHLARLWDRSDLLDSADAIAPDLLPGVRADQALDVLGGTAGTLLATLPLVRLRPNGPALETALSCGEHLIAATDAHDRRWKGIGIKRGFSHGISGVAYALDALATLTQDSRFAEAAIEALDFERALLEGGKWTDTHQFNGRPQVAWCHGAPGIALARLGIYRRRGNDPRVREDLVHALGECREHHHMTSQCLCHGTLGNLEPLLIAAAEFPELGVDRELVTRSANRVLQEISTTGWRSMLPNQTLSDGLLTGVAGIGYGFLRLRDPQGVPSVLMLDGPR